MRDSLARESIYSIGNGYMGVRGFPEEGGQFPSEIGTYMSGVFDNYDKHFVDLVNVPNFLFCRISVDGKPVDISSGTVTRYQGRLDLRTGVLTRQYRFTDASRRITDLAFERFLSMDNVHTAVQRIKVIPVNHSSRVEVLAGLDGSVTNLRQFDDATVKDVVHNYHFNEVENGGLGKDGAFLRVVTRNTGVEIAQAFTLKTSFRGRSILVKNDGIVGRRITWKAEKGSEYQLTKYVTVFASRDKGISEPVRSARDLLARQERTGYEGLKEANRLAWENIWRVSDIRIEGNPDDQKTVRFNIFHLVAGDPRNDERASIGPRSLTHTRYKGCAFWDVEVFMLPYFIYTDPGAARNLLMYRYHHLDAARERAKKQYLRGAQFPWMSANDGSEQCQAWAYADCEIHITADIAYAVWHYFQATNDTDFLAKHGAEILIETARYWASRSHYSSEKKAYVIPVVKGPDEYCGVTSNNAYTNLMAAANLRMAAAAADLLRKHDSKALERLSRKIGLETKEMGEWRRIARRMYVNRDRKRNLIIQDDTFLDSEPWDVMSLIADGRPAAGKIPYSMLHRIRIIKQADVILMMYLLSNRFSEKEKRAAWKFYMPLTVHDSSLSYNTHAIMASELGCHALAYDFFKKTLGLDMNNSMGNTDKGVHSASLGGTWQTIVNGFAGLRLIDGRLHLNPKLPKAWKSLSFHLRYRGSLLRVDMKRTSATVSLVEGTGPVEVYLKGRRILVGKQSD